jgi:hypothetical protein
MFTHQDVNVWAELYQPSLSMTRGVFPDAGAV